MKVSVTTNKTFLLSCLLIIGFFSSCSSEDNEINTERTGTEVVSLIQKLLYTSEGKVHANQLEDYQEGEYALITEDEKDACRFFTLLTGVEAPLNSSYEYDYKFEMNGKACKISIKGTEEAKNGIFATVYFSVPNCSEIKIIHIGTDSILKGENTETTITTEIIKVPIKV